MLQDAEVVVIGAGAFGTSTAYHLDRLGKRVALLEKRALVSQTSPRAAGLAQQVRADVPSMRLAMRSVQKIERFAAETGQELTFHQSGSVKVARTSQAAEQLHREVERGRAAGLDIQLISAAEARRLAPFLQPDGALALWYCSTDLYLEPRDLPLAYTRAAAALGVTLLPDTAVNAIGTRDGSIERVITDKGEIRTPVVVDTAGAWTNVVAAMTGIRVPIVPTRHQLYITEPIAGITAHHPIVRVLDARAYVRPERGGLMVGGYEPDPLQVDLNTLPAGFQIADLTLDFEPLRILTESVRDLFPSLQGAGIAEFRGGLPTMTADGHYILDRVPGVEGFYVVTGCCVGGLSTSPAIGEAMAAWIADVRPPLDLSPFSLRRFGPEPLEDERLRAACTWQYVHFYSDEQMPADLLRHGSA